MRARALLQSIRWLRQANLPPFSKAANGETGDESRLTRERIAMRIAAGMASHPWPPAAWLIAAALCVVSVIAAAEPAPRRSLTTALERSPGPTFYAPISEATAEALRRLQKRPQRARVAPRVDHLALEAARIWEDLQ